MDKKFYSKCDLCDSPFQYGPHQYDGKFIPKYKITVCMNCYSNNWDGWAPHYEEKLIENLKKNQLPIPERNVNGWLPRD